MLQLDAEALYAELLGGVRGLFKPETVLSWVLCFVSEPGQVGSQGGIRHKESIDADQKL